MGGFLRLISVTVVSGLTQGCLMSPPPEYKEPALVRPSIHVFDAQPAASQVLVVERGVTTVRFRVPVDFVPSTEPIEWQLWLDYDLEGTEYIKKGTISDVVTEVSYDWDVPMKLGIGCQQVTLLVAHRSSFGDSGVNDPVITEGARGDVAQVSWWLNVDPEPGQQQTLVNCPSLAGP